MDRASNILPAIKISKRLLQRAEVLEMERGDTPSKQELVYNSRPFVLCGLPVKRPPKGVLLHERRNGKFQLQVTGHPDWGLPFGQDRLILIWISTLALRQQSRTVRFHSAAELLDTFGLQKDGHTYRRLVAGFQRIFGATIFFRRPEESAAVFAPGRFNFFDRARIWYGEPNQQLLPSDEFANWVLLTEQFWEELTQHPIPINLKAVRLLANAPAELDFYTWLVWRSWTAGRQVSIPLSGFDGLIQQLGISDKTTTFEFRRQLKRWLQHIKAQDIWPECPAQISADGAALVLSHAKAIAARTGR